MTIKNYEPTDDFYIQKMYVTNVRRPRFEFIGKICSGKKVLHIGCADTMVFNVDTNLHIYLSRLKNVKVEREQALKERVKKAITARNIARAKSVASKTDPSGDLELSNAELEAANAVMFHTEMEKLKLTQIDGLDIDVETTNRLKQACPGTYYTSYKDVNESYDTVIIPEVMEHVPNVDLFLKDIFSIQAKEYLFTVPSMAVAEIFCTDEYALEVIHRDHKYWFSPYTLFNTIKPFCEGFNIQMYFLENKTQIAMRIFKE